MFWRTPRRSSSHNYHHVMRQYYMASVMTTHLVVLNSTHLSSSLRLLNSHNRPDFVIEYVESPYGYDIIQLGI